MNTLEKLIKLQEIDQRLLEIKEHMGDLPATVETQELEIKSIKESNSQKKEMRSEIEIKIRQYEAEIEDLTAHKLSVKIRQN